MTIVKGWRTARWCEGAKCTYIKFQKMSQSTNLSENNDCNINDSETRFTGWDQVLPLSPRSSLHHLHKPLSLDHTNRSGARRLSALYKEPLLLHLSEDSISNNSQRLSSSVHSLPALHFQSLQSWLCAPVWHTLLLTSRPACQAGSYQSPYRPKSWFRFGVGHLLLVHRQILFHSNISSIYNI
jgi:hypothetical protein